MPITYISDKNDLTTLINVFVVDTQSQEKLVNVLKITESIIQSLPGFILANIQSLGGTRVVNYA